jgi:hypothetical protein
MLDVSGGRALKDFERETIYDVTTFADFGIMGGGNNLLYQRSNSNII